MQYRTGTVSVTNGDATITFSGATTGAENVAPGTLFKLDADGAPMYEVASRTPSSGPSLTSLELTAPYAGATAAGQPYILCWEFTPKGIPLLSQGDADAADILRRAFALIDSLLDIAGSGITEMVRVPTITMVGGEDEQLITFSGPANTDYVVIANKTWNTDIREDQADRTTTQCKLKFINAPASGDKLRVIIAYF